MRFYYKKLEKYILCCIDINLFSTVRVSTGHRKSSRSIVFYFVSTQIWFAKTLKPPQFQIITITHDIYISFLLLNCTKGISIKIKTQLT
jgi:hypothetical protein